MADYGVDMRGAEDISPTLRDIGSPELMPQVILRRLYTPRGSLLSAPGIVTTDLRGFMSSDVSPDRRQLTTIKAVATQALMDDPRILRVHIVAQYDQTQRAIVLGITGDGSDGPFELTISVTAATVQILNRG